MKPHLIPFLLMLASATCIASCSSNDGTYTIHECIEGVDENDVIETTVTFLPEGSETEEIDPNVCIITFDGDRTIVEMPMTMVDSAEFHSKTKSARFMSHEKVDSIINANDISILNPQKDIYKISHRRTKDIASGMACGMIKSSDTVYIIFDIINLDKPNRSRRYSATTIGVEAIKQNDGKFALKALKNL